MYNEKLYTFEDWKNGIIESDFQEGLIENIKSDGFGRLTDKVYQAGLIPDHEYKKIKQVQKETFFNAVNITVNALLENFEETLHLSPDPEALLLEEKKLLEDYLDSAPKHDYREVLKGGWNSSGINHRIYKLVENLNDESTLIHVANPSSIPDDNLRNRGLEHFAGLVNMVTEKLFPEVDLPKNSKKFNLNNYVQNDHYHIAVYLKFLNGIEQINFPLQQIGKKASSKNKDNYPDPYDIAEKFKKERTKSGDETYSIKDIAFVMRLAKKFDDVSSYKKIIDACERDDKCPENIKGIRYATTQNWIKFYDKNADIKRKKDSEE